jgi:hypothetical protein
MSFALTPASPFVDAVSVVPASWFNFVRNALPDTVDGAGGGTYNLLPAHTLDFPAGGGNISIEAPFSVTDGNIPVGGVLAVDGIVNIDSGAWIDVLSGGLIKLESGGTIEAKSGGVIKLDAGGLLLSLNGSNLELAGETYIVDLGGGGTYGSLLIGDSVLGTGRITVTANGSVTFQSSALCTWGPGSEALFSGAGALCQFQTNATLFMGSSAGAATFNNLVTLGGAVTQLASYTKSTGTARTFLRRGLPTVFVSGTTWDSTCSFDPSQLDLVEIPFPTGAWTWTLTAPPGNAYCEVTIRVCANASGQPTIQLEDEDSTIIGFLYTDSASGIEPDTRGCIRLAYGAKSATDTTGRWRAIEWSGSADGV